MFPILIKSLFILLLYGIKKRKPNSTNPATQQIQRIPHHSCYMRNKMCMPKKMSTVEVLDESKSSDIHGHVGGFRYNMYLWSKQSYYKFKKMYNR